MFAAAKLSRYCAVAFDYPASTQDTGAFVDSIVEFVRAHSIDLIIPVTDWTLEPISRHRSRFADCRIAMPSQIALDAISNKFRTIELAESLGVAVPRTLLVESAEDLAKWKGNQFPVVVKDLFSVRWINSNAVFG